METNFDMMNRLNAVNLAKEVSSINKNDDIVCRCRSVTYEQIQAAVRAGAKTLDKVKEETGCCKDCGLCTSDVRGVIAEAKDTRSENTRFNI